ncbi:phosphatidylinositol-3-phosphatase myotubularin-1 [Cynara cardunculus var. scolymus]|uniref:phosphatidylinositol-3-phosphatase myotubularin-1 n=1 Tax=Cynara cardunculus var. scolymus TaxID=59895 RepID=UPI000D6254EA|nr:phosphatidylinositol-3-phosphatase myotubularin-1 [Cynara cardunculus var. scolymus]
MASPSARRSTSLGEAETRLTDSDKIEGKCGLDAADWTKIDHPASYGLSEILLKAERVMADGYGVLVNTDEAGTVFVTNFRLLFLSEGSRDVIALGTIPLATIEKFNKIVIKQPSGTRQSEKTPTRRLLQVVGKDMRIIIFAFRPRTKQRRAVFVALSRWTRPARLWDLYAFSSGPSKCSTTNPKVRLMNEYYRLLGMGSIRSSIGTIERGSFKLSNDWWRISDVNTSYDMCSTYPYALLVPKSIRDKDLLKACTFRARCRLPVISWCDKRTGAVLARSSQPLVGLMMNMRSNADENLVGALCTRLSSGKEGRRKLYIADARPRKNALANGAMGGGSESSSNYFQSEIVFFGIDNIHAMRESLVRLRDYLDTHGTKSSDGMSSFLRNGGWTWGGGNLSSMSASVSTFGDSGWLIHIQNVLAGSAWIAARVALESASMLVHCSDGWDRTSQLVALASLLLDPYYRTIDGFQALVEKDWLAFGHPFSDRAGMPSFTGSGNMPLEISRHSSSPNICTSSLRQSSGSLTSQAPVSSNTQHSNNYSPIFLQWVDCVSQLLRIYPFAFEFSSVFLVDFLDCVLSCRFGNFLCNSENEREKAGVFDACACLWKYLDDMRASEGSSHVHYNIFYKPSKHDGPLLPPAAALAPTLWPQFHLRWSCPSETQSGEVEAQCRNMMEKYSELERAKDVAERYTREITTTVKSLTADLLNENQVSNSAVALAKKASRENTGIKRAIESLGCRVHVSANIDDNHIADIEDHPADLLQTLTSSPTGETVGDGHIYDEKTDMFVSIAVAADDDVTVNPTNRICETLCPLRTQDGGCRWPNAGCARLRSQFVGLRADYDAFDRLSIQDSYFQPE